MYLIEYFSKPGIFTSSRPPLITTAYPANYFKYFFFGGYAVQTPQNPVFFFFVDVDLHSLEALIRSNYAH